MWFLIGFTCPVSAFTRTLPRGANLAETAEAVAIEGTFWKIASMEFER
jgi:hypothetical protein